MGPRAGNLPMIRSASHVFAGFLLSLLPASALVVLRAGLLEPGLQGRWLLCARQAISMAVVGAVLYLLLAFAPRKEAAAATMLTTAVLAGGSWFIHEATRPAQDKWGAIQALERELTTRLGKKWIPPLSEARVVHFSPLLWQLAPRDSFLALALGDDPFQMDHVVVEVDVDGLVRKVYIDYF